LDAFVALDIPRKKSVGHETGKGPTFSRAVGRAKSLTGTAKGRALPGSNVPHGVIQVPTSRESRQLYQIAFRDSLDVVPGFSPRRQASHDNERVESVLSQ